MQNTKHISFSLYPVIYLLTESSGEIYPIHVPQLLNDLVLLKLSNVLDSVECLLYFYIKWLCTYLFVSCLLYE